MEYIKSLFRGRLSRLSFLLGNVSLLVITLLIIFVQILIFKERNSSWGYIDFYSFIWIVFSSLILISVNLINISMSIRRFHDLGYSGLIAFLMYVPIIGIVPLILSFLEPSDPKYNQYGEIPNKKNQFPYDVLAILPIEKKQNLSLGNKNLLIISLTIFFLGWLSGESTNATFGYHMISLLIRSISYSVILYIFSAIVTGIIGNFKTHSYKIFLWLFFSASVFQLMFSLFQTIVKLLFLSI